MTNGGPPGRVRASTARFSAEPVLSVGAAAPKSKGSGRPGALALLAVALAACGYQLGAGAARLPPGAERVFVRPLENRTTNAEVGALVATSLRQELARRRADGDSAAPARIEGAVEEATFGASSPNGATYRLALVVSARLVVNDRVVAEQRARREEDWLAGLDALESEGRRRLAMRRAAEGLARELLDRFEVP